MIHVLLTVPNLRSTQSPYREMIAIAKYLRRDDFKLTICSLRESGYQETEPVLKSLGISCFVGRFRPRGHTVRHIRTCLMDQGLIRRHGPFDIQHSLDFTPSPIEAIFARTNSRLYMYNQRDNSENGSKAMLRIKIFLSHRIIPISDGTTNLLLNYGASPSKLRKIYNGIDVQDGSKDLFSQSSRDHFYILAVGQIIRRKRYEDAIRTFSHFSQTVPDSSLNIAGEVLDPDYFLELQNLVEKLGISEKVRFLGVCGNVMKLLDQARALIHCSESEGVPWVILEAMMQGVPIVASNIDGIKEVLETEQTGLLVPTGDINGFSKELLRIAEDSELTATLTKKASEVVREKYSARAMVEQLQNVYREMVS